MSDQPIISSHICNLTYQVEWLSIYISHIGLIIQSNSRIKIGYLAS
jgi:hypothetical protein